MSASYSNDEIEDKFFLLGQREILGALNELAHRREPVTVYFNDGKQFIVTMILSARSDGLVFDVGGDAGSNKRLEQAKTCVFLAFPDGIRVQFSGVDPQPFTWGDQDAFWVPIPKRVVRMQRREYFRNQLPIIDPLMVKLYDDKGQMIANWPIYDLSVGGLSVQLTGAPELKLQDRVAKMLIVLGARNIVHCEGVVRHITSLDRTTSGKHRVGLSFQKLPHDMDVAIQKHINQLEYERRKLLPK
ncbi:flagellar brake protein [Undibacterium sp. CY18W]|uniref:Flagellar brake protein YcgR n=1 Tax=Undibacterium hunanense TaxID=2762292 RepID=A0ABR6ZX69_9BURK|nr:flagellar brake protein [Undibacterium hunanense]MBC3920446.1 flagellar brake protein [Undibacterium hunanense]